MAIEWEEMAIEWEEMARGVGAVRLKRRRKRRKAEWEEMGIEWEEMAISMPTGIRGV